MKCACGGSLLQKSGTETRLRTKGPLTFTRDGLCKGQCYWCGKAFEFPVSQIASANIPTEELYIKSDVPKT